MARFSIDDADKYGGQGGGGYFSLKNDGETARVRFLYNDINDVEGYAVHEVEIDGRKRYINCLRKYNESVDNCPFCRERKPQYAKLFVPLYNIDEDKVQVWERGKKFFAKLSSICARYANKEGLCSHVFEIERNGKPGDTQTSYEIYEVDNDGAKLEDLPEFEGMSGIVLEKTAEEMEKYLATGSFDSESTSTVRRGGSENTVSRRTPASRSRGDRF